MTIPFSKHTQIQEWKHRRDVSDANVINHREVKKRAKGIYGNPGKGDAKLGIMEEGKACKENHSVAVEK